MGKKRAAAPAAIINQVGGTVAKEIQEVTIPADRDFRKKWPPQTESYNVNGGDNIAIVGMKTAVKLNEARRAALEAAITAITGVQVAVVTHVATIPTPPTDWHFVVSVEGSIKILPDS